MSRALYTFRARGKTLALGRRTAIVGVINVTPDSFSDGGRFLEPARAVEEALRLIAAGADIVDVGGESTRPGAEPVSVQEELRRVLPVIEALAGKRAALVSVDTTKSEVVRQALEAGADIVNDVSGLTAEPSLADVVAEFKAGLIVMHRKGSPKDMQEGPRYEDLFGEVRACLAAAVSRAEEVGVPSEAIFVDPGIGFGKTTAHNLKLLEGLEFLTPLGKPVLVGPSRKTFIGQVLGVPVDARQNGTAAAVAAAVLRGAHAVRVHDLPAMAEVARMADAIAAGEPL